jgi:ketosteroid isomerase-like protein
VHVAGDWAYVWTELTITMQPIGGAAAVHRRGPGLSVWRKNRDGAWVIFRDANMVATETKT